MAIFTQYSLERAAIEGNTGQKKSCQSFSLTPAHTVLT